MEEAPDEGVREGVCGDDEAPAAVMSSTRGAVRIAPMPDETDSGPAGLSHRGEAGPPPDLAAGWSGLVFPMDVIKKILRD